MLTDTGEELIILICTFLFIAQNLQSDVDGGRIWFTISLLTGTFSFFREAESLADSLMAMTCKDKNKWFDTDITIPKAIL